MKLSVMHGRPSSLTQALTFALEFESLIQQEESTATEPKKKVRAVRAKAEPAAEKGPELPGPKTSLEEMMAKLGALLEKLQSPPERRSRRDVTCYFCQKKGHYQSDCWAKNGRPGEARPAGTNPAPVTGTDPPKAAGN